MKKAVFILILFALAAGAFAVDVSLDAQLSSTVFNPYLTALGGTGYAIPKIGVGIDVGPVEILANMLLQIFRNNFRNPDRSETLSIFGMYFGVAPKLKMEEKLYFTFPIYFKTYIIGQRARYSYTVPDPTPKTNVLGAFGIDAGGRAYYRLTEKWSAFLGFQLELMSFFGKGRTTDYGGKKTDGVTTDLYWFDTGYIDLGVRITF